MKLGPACILYQDLKRRREEVKEEDKEKLSLIENLRLIPCCTDTHEGLTLVWSFLGCRCLLPFLWWLIKQDLLRFGCQDPVTDVICGWIMKWVQRVRKFSDIAFKDLTWVHLDLDFFTKLYWHLYSSRYFYNSLSKPWKWLGESWFWQKSSPWNFPKNNTWHAL